MALISGLKYNLRPDSNASGKMAAFEVRVKCISACAWSLLLTFAWPALGANFSDIKERGATDTGSLLATSDTEIGEIGPSPPGCEANPWGPGV